MHRYQDALSCFDQALTRQAANPTYLNNRALAFYHLGKLDEAIADLNTATGIAPKEPSAYFHRGNALLAAGRPTEALTDLQQAYALSRQANGLPVDSDSDTEPGTERSRANSEDAADSDDSDDSLLRFRARHSVMAARKAQQAAAKASSSGRRPKSQQGSRRDNRRGVGSGSGRGSPARAQTALGTRRSPRRKSPTTPQKTGTQRMSSFSTLKSTQSPSRTAEAMTGFGVDANTPRTSSRGGDIVTARQRHSIGLAHQALRQHETALRNFKAALREDPSHVCTFPTATSSS